MLDLTAEAQANQPDLDGLIQGYSPEELALAERTWRGRMVNEYSSASVWAGLVSQLMRANAPQELVQGAADAIDDELQHARQCAGVVLALGGEPTAPEPTIETLPAHDDAGPVEAVLRNLVSVGCMSETIAVSIIRAEHAELEPGPLRDVLKTILADEIQHARVGWKGLGLLLPRLDDSARERLGAYLIDAFEHQIRFEIPKLPVLPQRRDELAQVGVCDGGGARALFFDTLATIVVPGLASVGLPAAQAYAAALDHTSSFLEAS